MRARKGITLVISKKDWDEIMRITKSLENSGAQIDGVSKTVKTVIKR